VSREKFFEMVKDTLQSRFNVSMDKVLGHFTLSGKIKEDNVRDLFFGDYMSPDGERVYDEVTDFKLLTKTFEQ